MKFKIEILSEFYGKRVELQKEKTSNLPLLFNNITGKSNDDNILKSDMNNQKETLPITAPICVDKILGI